MARETAEQYIHREVKRVVSEAGPTVADAARNLRIDRRKLYRWMKGLTAAQLHELAQAAGVTVTLGATEKEPPPLWARALTDEVLDAIAGMTARIAAQSAAEAALARRSRTPGAGARGSGGSPRGTVGPKPKR